MEGGGPFPRRAAAPGFLRGGGGDFLPSAASLGAAGGGVLAAPGPGAPRGPAAAPAGSRGGRPRGVCGGPVCGAGSQRVTSSGRQARLGGERQGAPRPCLRGSPGRSAGAGRGGGGRYAPLRAGSVKAAGGSAQPPAPPSPLLSTARPGGPLGSPPEALVFSQPVRRRKAALLCRATMEPCTDCAAPPPSPWIFSVAGGGLSVADQL